MWSTRALFVYQNDELYDSLPQFAQCTCANNHPTPSTLSYVPIIFDRYTKSHSRLEPEDGVRLDNSTEIVIRIQLTQWTK